MFVQELIDRLQELKEQVGNVEVEICMDDIDGTSLGLNDINEVDISTSPIDHDKKIYIAHLNK